MKITAFWASVALFIPRAIAVSATSTTSTTSTAAAPTCTASLIASLCSYENPGAAVAIESRAACWDYCNDHPPCNFVIFNAGNPTLGTGTCWLYPGGTYDPSKGSSSCTNSNGDASGDLSVYSKPVCSGGSATTTAGGCAATETPTAIASVCGYPQPDDNCFYDCTASDSAANCLSQCAKADSCSYVVFNSHDSNPSPYTSGTCWMYPNGTFNAQSATTCSGAPDQFVYKNECPKPSTSSSSSHSSAATGSTGTGTTGAILALATTNSNGTATAGNATGSTTTNKNSAPAGLSLTNPLAAGVAILILQAL
ncbi:hypothetical protein F1880_007296 [Penicillium rolfsii]|nr:hypothetical protein F1880_007296 [Penicillium rolfsii]